MGYLKKISSVASELDSFYRDCVITVALKIVGKTCKMSDFDKIVFLLLFDALTTKESKLFEPIVFDVIQKARDNPNEFNLLEVGKLREKAMQIIPKHSMKEFKSNIRTKIKGN